MEKAFTNYNPKGKSESFRTRVFYYLLLLTLYLLSRHSFFLDLRELFIFLFYFDIKHGEGLCLFRSRVQRSRSKYKNATPCRSLKGKKEQMKFRIRQPCCHKKEQKKARLAKGRNEVTIKTSSRIHNWSSSGPGSGFATRQSGTTATPIGSSSISKHQIRSSTKQKYSMYELLYTSNEGNNQNWFRTFIVKHWNLFLIYHDVQIFNEGIFKLSDPLKGENLSLTRFISFSKNV